MIGIVVDSNSQMPRELADRYGVEVVALLVTVDGVEYREGVDLDADTFYAAWNDGYVPEIATSQPSPGAFVEAYQHLADRGVDEILSIHVAESMSGTLNSARLGAQGVDVPVTLIDTGTASFGISCCAWAAAHAIEGGADLAAAAEIARSKAASLRTSFVVGVPSLVDRSGRGGDVEVEAAASAGVPVLAMTGSDLSVLTTTSNLDDAVHAMVDDALAWAPRSEAGLRIAVGTSDDSSRPLALAITELVAGSDDVAVVLQYRIGPSIGAHTGPGTAGLFVF